MLHKENTIQERKLHLQHSTQKDSEWQHLQQWGPWKEKNECYCIVDLLSESQSTKGENIWNVLCRWNDKMPLRGCLNSPLVSLNSTQASSQELYGLTVFHMVKCHFVTAPFHVLNTPLKGQYIIRHSCVPSTRSLPPPQKKYTNKIMKTKTSHHLVFSRKRTKGVFGSGTNILNTFNTKCHQIVIILHYRTTALHTMCITGLQYMQTYN